jgi:hypothetical protein
MVVWYYYTTDVSPIMIGITDIVALLLLLLPILAH